MKHKLFFKKEISFCKAFSMATALFIFSNGFSQTVTPGIRAGFNFTNWNLSEVSGIEPLSLGNPGAGIFATVCISKSFSLEPGVSLAYLGSELRYSDLEHITSRLTYLQFPIVARYELKNRIAFYTGPQVGFLTAATMQENDGEKQKAKAAFKKNELSIVSGVEYYFRTGIGIRLNYTAGLSDIYAQGKEKISNYSFGLSVAYKFNVAIGKRITKS